MKLINIHNRGRKLFLFCRDSAENLIVKEENTFYPYFYEPDESGKFKSFDGKKLRKVACVNPYDMVENRTSEAYEADIHYTKRYIIDKIDTIEKSPIKWTLIDVETKSPELPNPQYVKYPISCISAYNSLYDSIQTWYLADYDDEQTMLKAFADYMKKEQFDLWLNWNVAFDWLYTYNRYPVLFGTDFAE